MGLITDLIKKGYFDKPKKLTKEDTIKMLAAAFNRNSYNLIAVKSKHCCSDHEILAVMNQKVLLRKMLEDLNFEEELISKYLHYNEPK